MKVSGLIVTAGYLDQHSVLEEGQTVRDVLRTAFWWVVHSWSSHQWPLYGYGEEGADVDALMEEVENSKSV